MPAIIPIDAVAPLRLNRFAEGGTLAYLIRIGGRQILVFGSVLVFIEPYTAVFEAKEVQVERRGTGGVCELGGSD
jgi:hypothetical protein